MRTTPAPLSLIAPILVAAVAHAAAVRSVSVDAYEVYTEVTVALDGPAAFTCEAGAEPRTLVLTVAADAPKGLSVPPAGRIQNVRVARAKGATTFIVTTTADVGTFRAYFQREPATVAVGVFRRLELTPPRPEPLFKRFLSNRKLLLVDDDDGPGNGNKYSVDVDAKYRDALQRLGVPFDAYVVRAGRDGPSAAELAAYPLVIWFNGLDARPVVISAADERAMASYVEGGGRLLLISQNYLSDASRARTPFCREVLGITSYQADTQVAEVIAGPGVSLPQEKYGLSNDLTIIGNWGDGFRPPADAASFFVGPGDGLCYGMVRPVGGGKAAFFSFALENAGYVNRIADIMAAALDALAADD
ncbi:MAG TPA: hypothetical protein VMX79_02320 [bacterium]|nr:hypothetical protein [bacterium]